jgi:uncharacterized protein
MFQGVVAVQKRTKDREMVNALRESRVPGTAPQSCVAAEESLSRALVDLLLRPTVYPDRPTKVETIETHISWVFLTDRFVYKLKKPVHFDFLDFSTVDARLRACQAECDLNQRLAPQVYLGVLPITIDFKGKVAIGGAGKTIDWLVKMRRLPAVRMLDELIRSEHLTYAETNRLANWLANYYHGLSPVFTDADGYRAAIEQHVRSNRRELLSPVHELPGELVKRCHAAQLRFLLLEHAQFEARVCDGRIVDGHGDLRPEHVCLDGQPVVFDCIEFNDELRRIDVADELSFLAMECEYLKAAQVGQRIIEAYREQSHDHFSAELGNFYKCYRACVRAKVAALADAQNPHAARVPRRSLAYLELADRYALQLGPPTVIIVCGLMGSGKTTLATSLADRLGSELLSTDFVRRELLGPSVAPAAFDEGHYSAGLRQRVYNVLLHRAELVLRERMSVVLDGAFLTSAQRHAATALARGGGAVPLVVHCDCPAEVAIQRIDQRAVAGATLSEARSELYSAQQSREEPFDGVDVNVDTTTPLRLQESQVLAALRGQMQRQR